MRKFISKRTIVWGGLLAVGIVIWTATFYFFQIINEAAPEIRDIRITNKTDSSITISWVSIEDSETKLYVVEAEDAMPQYTNQVPVLGTDLAAYGDDRDSRNETNKWKTHHVTLTDLEPKTEYTIGIGSKYKIFTYTDLLTSFSLSPREEIPAPNVPLNAYGIVEDFDSQHDTIRDGILYYRVTSGGAESAWYSTILTENAAWATDVGNLYTESGERIPVFDESKIETYVESAAGAGTKTFTIKNSAPAPTIVVNVRYKND